MIDFFKATRNAINNKKRDLAPQALKSAIKNIDHGFKPYHSGFDFLASVAPPVHIAQAFACDLALMMLDVLIGACSAIKMLIDFAIIPFTHDATRGFYTMGDIFKSGYNLLCTMVDVALCAAMFVASIPLVAAGVVAKSLTTVADKIIPVDIDWSVNYTY